MFLWHTSAVRLLIVVTFRFHLGYWTWMTNNNDNNNISNSKRDNHICIIAHSLARLLAHSHSSMDGLKPKLFLSYECWIFFLCTITSVWISLKQNQTRYWRSKSHKSDTFHIPVDYCLRFFLSFHFVLYGYFIKRLSEARSIWLWESIHFGFESAIFNFNG